MNTVIHNIQQALQAQADPIKADFFPHFFTPEPGDSDQFLGVTVPKQRRITRQYYKQLTPSDVLELLHSPVHEERLTALMIWVLQYQKGDDATRKEIYELYLKNTRWVNNWDLVDSSCRDIVGQYIFDKDQSILDKLSNSKNIWERRIAMVATWYFIRRGEFAWTLKLAEHYLHDTHHYIHKATGWMLREVGKKDRAVLVEFLDKHAAAMPRTALRYAIEHFDPVTRAQYLAKRAAI
jgi:3-methyladenine DNA glycosylase AlkD